MTNAFSLREVSIEFEQSDGSIQQVLRDIDLDVPEGQFIALVGRSGGGKTTVLNAIAGLLEPASGTLEVLGTTPIGARAHLGFMPARDALLPWRTALRNVEYGLELRGTPRAERKAAAARYLEMVGLGDSLGRWPWQLSQGMRQRAALARCWVLEPQLLLMDEPFAALDAVTRVEVQDQFRAMLDSGDRRTVLLVTHDLEEAILLADRIVVLGGGSIVADVDVPSAAGHDHDDLLASPERVALLRELRAALSSDEGAASRRP